MTALQSRRRRRTVFGGIAATVLMVAAIAMTVVGVLTLRDSEEGETVGIDTRPVLAFPETPNLLLAVTDDEGRLATFVVATLLPEGRGGSIVTVPVNADANIGLGTERQPVASVFAADDPEGFATTVESLLSITVERVEIADPGRLSEIVEPLVPIEVDLPEDVIDSDTFGTGIVVTAGPHTLRGLLTVDALTAIDESGAAYDHHPNKVELWSGLARQTPVGEEDAGTSGSDDAEELEPPATNDEFFERLWSGPVQVRDIDTDPGLTALAENPDGVDVVVLDRRDSLLVFAQVSPSLVSTPNLGLAFRLEVRYSDEQLAQVADEFSSRSQVSRTLIGELLFFQANVVSVDPAPASGGAPSVTRIEVAEEQFIDEMREFAPIMFGESDVVEAPTLIDGVDIVVKLGTGYLDTEARQTAATVFAENADAGSEE